MKIAAFSILLLLALFDAGPSVAQRSDAEILKMNDTNSERWLLRWERSILRENSMRYCNNEMGEELGWKTSVFLNGFYYGYLATGNIVWLDKLVACTDAWLNRAVKEPDGYVGWPKVGAAGTKIDNLDDFYADSMLGEAMALTPVVLMAAEIRRTPSLKTKYGSKADNYVEFAEQIFGKWDARGGWRETDDGGMVSVELPFGIDKRTGNWTGAYENRDAPGAGFSHQGNKANLIANWLLAMFDATAKPVYRERAKRWFQIMRSRMKLKPDGTYEIWNYWEPAGAWDYRPNGMPKHWIGVHRNGDYYEIDDGGIVSAYKHGLVFSRDDIDRLVATAIGERRYWTALVPFDRRIQKQFEDTLDPSSWGGLSGVPWYLANQLGKAP
jgi:hypothetical protein